MCCPRTRRSRSHWPAALQPRSGPWQGARGWEDPETGRFLAHLSTTPSNSEGQSFWDNQTIIPNECKALESFQDWWKKDARSSCISYCKADYFILFWSILLYFHMYSHGQKAAMQLLLTSCRLQRCAIASSRTLHGRPGLQSSWQGMALGEPRRVTIYCLSC